MTKDIRDNKILTFNIDCEEYHVVRFSVNEETRVSLNIDNIVNLSKKNNDFNNSTLDELLEENNNLLKCFEK